jgi:hypothetical protein
MKNYLGTLDLAIWLLLIAGKVFLCLCIFKKKLFRRMLGFPVYVLTFTIKSVALYAIALWASYATYYYAYYLTSQIESLLAFLTLLECGRRVLPGLNLPKKEKAISLLLASLTVVVAFASLWPMRYIEKRIEMGAFLAIAITFFFIAFYSRYLGLYWSRLLGGICSCLGLLYLVDGISKALTGHYAPAIMIQVRQISQIANVLAVIAWIIVALSPWGESVMTEEDLQTLEAAFAKIEDSLGAERVKAI